ncbi:DUF6906 family protein [Brevibacillus borstelensis]|uniref:DUF6906 family protein n=1 Tax=Brevibacillus borstelensis TaxID=45462 RepID=UPI000AA1E253|nr:hypothetical protein [Brevibacillus borstelensis]
MKQPKKPTRRQKEEIVFRGLTPQNWLVERDTPDEFVVVHRYTGTTKRFGKLMA